MTQQTTFQWLECAHLYAGETAVPRPADEPSKGFRSLIAGTVHETVSFLGAALRAGDPFCISDVPLPETTASQPGDFLTLTGGSSGVPKVICRTQASWIASFMVNAGLFDYAVGQSVAVLGRLSHSLALYGVTEALHLGLHAHVLADLSPNRQRAALADHRIQTLYATPSQLRLILSGHSDARLPALTHIHCGGGMMDAALRADLQTLCPNAHIRVFYGAAETSFVSLTDDTTPEGSVGKPYPVVELRITNEEVFVRSPYLCKGYASGEVLTHDDGFISVAEMGSLDTQGHLWLKGRKSRMVRIAEHSVFPEALEAVILAQTDTLNCVVLPVPDATRGQQLTVIVEGTQSTRLSTAIKNTCRATFGPLIAPRHVLFRGSLPVLASGKPDLVALARWLEDQT